VTVPPQVADARRALGRQLASLRENAGLTQAEAAGRIRYSRSAVARAEATGVCSRDFCRLAGRLYGAGEDLAIEHDHIAALATAASTQAARRARQRRAPTARGLRAARTGRGHVHRPGGRLPVLRQASGGADAAEHRHCCRWGQDRTQNPPVTPERHHFLTYRMTHHPAHHGRGQAAAPLALYWRWTVQASDSDSHWVKSSLSFSNSNCVQVASLPDGSVGVRNSRHPEGPVLRFTGDEWQAFLGGVLNGEFDGFGQ